MELKKMKISIANVTMETVEVELPAYRKSRCHFYKVFSDTHCIEVCTLKNYHSVSFYNSSNALHRSHEECTKEEFEAALKETIAILNAQALS